MNHYYEDIISRISEKPKWFDENAVPRYCDFHPDKVADIYANEAALVLIRCQNCHTNFKVAFSSHGYAFFKGKLKPFNISGRLLKDKYLYYHDPPNVGCCAAGPTMNSESLKVLEFWQKSVPIREWERKWERKEDLEITFDYDETRNYHDF